jgi:hypothetical protein
VLHSVLHEVQQREIVEIEIVGGHQDRDITYPHLDVNSENERMRELRHRSIDDEATLARFQNSFTKDSREPRGSASHAEAVAIFGCPAMLN